jgi:YbbR domain-containing protein
MLRGLLFENLGLKLSALLLALVVYLNVYTDRPADMIVSFPLEFEGLEDSLAIAGPVPAVVQAELRGTGKQLLRLRLTEPPIKVSLVGVRPGQFTRSLKVEDLPIIPGEGIEVERLVGPSALLVQIDRRLVRHLPVAPRVNGFPAQGYIWNGVVIAQPASVEVTGPARVLAGLDSVRLRPVGIGGKRDTVRAQETPDGLPEGCIVDPGVVRVLVPVKRGGH